MGELVLSKNAERLREAGRHLGLWTHGLGLNVHARQLFGQFDFRGKTVLEIGCGNGVFTMWAALQGATCAIGLEPIGDGASQSSRVHQTFHDLRQILGLKNVELVPNRLQDYSTGGRSFDLVCGFASVNHWDEASCKVLSEKARARESYKDLFRKIHQMTKPGAKLVLTDCARQNLFPLVGLRNPLKPSINWSLHQNPDLWGEIISEAGFSDPKIAWLSGNILRRFQLAEIPHWFSFLTTSYFRLELVRNGAS